MKRLAILAAGLIAAGAAVGAAAQTGVFDPRPLKSAHPAEVMVFGTAHLSQLPKTFRVADLAPLLDRLAAWKPQAITIESLSGRQCEYLRRYAKLHDNAADGYCWDESPARAATGLDMLAATLEMERLLAALPADASPAQRRRLAAVMLAASDQASALVQWLRLPASERHIGDGLDQVLVDRLVKLETYKNEDYQIAAALAVRLGLDRIYPTDDHTASDDVSADPGYGAAVEAAWKAAPANAIRRKRIAREEAGLGTPDGTLAMFRSMNRRDQARLIYDSDFGAALKDPSPQGFGRNYVGNWETRNLRMVANIRAVLAKHPGIRLLTIVGASHKAYFEAYLAMMHDVRLVDSSTVLR